MRPRAEGVVQFLPLEQRVPRAFLLGQRWQLLQWRIPNVKVDWDQFELKSGCKSVATVSVADDKLMINWLDPAWKNWDELQTAPEFAKLVQDAENKIKRSSGQIGKGAGKGPHQ